MKFRDVCGVLRTLRDFLLGIKVPHQLHNRFNPLLAPRTLPPPDIPRTSVDRYSGIYYYTRHALDSVKPPVVGPIALGLEDSRKLSGTQQPAKPRTDSELVFPTIPTPGPPYWFDAHCYYECVPDVVRPPKPCPPKEPPIPPPCPPPPPPPCAPNPCESIKRVH
ncbi:unnamed protein product [Arctia plantaginis]|uniref:NADH dehydrogenase [ubiquinone] 1 alpha subcomplex subunit 7 n=1 Tax=Arctia plantaginis TaxID=874455 RepID=A0A8S1AUS8_ARCPL|nr:unnamed protein product [Arctia plantaginis]CAB3257895.1 unnamed protein product [Arctia plantaginis]